MINAKKQTGLPSFWQPGLRRIHNNIAPSPPSRPQAKRRCVSISGSGAQPQQASRGQRPLVPAAEAKSPYPMPEGAEISHKGAPSWRLGDNSEMIRESSQGVRLRSLLAGSATKMSPSSVRPRNTIKCPLFVKCPRVISATAKSPVAKCIIRFSRSKLSGGIDWHSNPYAAAIPGTIDRYDPERRAQYPLLTHSCAICAGSTGFCSSVDTTMLIAVGPQPYPLNGSAP